MTHLDTNFLILALEPGSVHDRALRRWFAEKEPVAISTTAWAEYLCGPREAETAHEAAALLSDFVPFLEEDSHRAASLFNASGRRRGSFVDCMIAAVALRSGARLATANPGDFRPFEGEGLQVITE